MSKELREMLGIETREIEIALVRKAVKKIEVANLRERARKVIELMQYTPINKTYAS